MDFKDLLRLARRRWKTIAAVFVLAVVAAGAISFSQTPIYHSTARIFISTDVSSSAEAYYAGGFAQQRVTSYADLATSGDVLNRVITRLNLDLTPTELASKITATVPANTVIISVETRDPNPRTAQQITQAEAEELTAYLAEIETPAGKNTTPVKATVTDAAVFDGTPIAPTTTLNIVVGAVIGLLMGCALAGLRDLLDTTVKTPEDVEAVVNSPVMAQIAFDSSVPKAPLLTDSGGHARRAEAFRVLRTNLQFLNLDRPPGSFIVTSSVPEEGKTTTATNLAIALAQAGKRVLLLDADLRRPRVAKQLGLESAVGLTTVLVGRSDLTSSIQVHQESGVHFLASGPVPPNPTDILQSQATRDLFKTLGDSYDVIVVDAPPLLPVADAGIMAADVDGVIMVVRHGKTTREQLTQAIARLDQVGSRPAGMVLNMVPPRSVENYAYGYNYYAPEQAPAAGRRSRRP